MAREERNPQSRNRTMIHVDESELSSSGNLSATYQGSAFTGYSVDRDGEFSAITTYVSGRQVGMTYEINTETGVLVDLTPLDLQGLPAGGSFSWDDFGRLTMETVIGRSGSVRVQRTWEENGTLQSDVRSREIGHDMYMRKLGIDFVPWAKRPNISVPENSSSPSFRTTVSDTEVHWDALDEKYRLRGEIFWGVLSSFSEDGRMCTRQVLDGRDEGPVWEWAPSGKLVLQGVLHHPYGRVGPWHEWDETGRLMSETIYDALGNHIIDRHFDQAGNLAHEQHHEPTRLWHDPDTGQQRPAPWLWF